MIFFGKAGRFGVSEVAREWLPRVVVFILSVAGILITVNSTIVHFKKERQLALLNTLRPDFERFFKVADTGRADRGYLKEYFDFFEYARIVMPDNDQVLFMLGNLYAFVGNEKRAEALLERADKVAPGFLFTQFDLALVYFHQGRYAETVALLQKALAMPANASIARIYSSLIYRQVLGARNAPSHIGQRLRGIYYDGHVLLAESLLRQGRYEELMKAAVSAIRIFPDHGVFMYYGGRAAAALGRPDVAASFLAKSGAFEDGMKVKDLVAGIYVRIL